MNLVPRTIDVESTEIPETPRMAGGLKGRIKTEMMPALAGGAMMTGMRIMSGEDVPSALVGGALSTAGGVGGQIAGESAARLAGRTAGKALMKSAVGQAGKALAAKAAGTAIGATLGSVIPGAGTFVGGAIGSIVGGIAGDMLANKVMGGRKEPQIDPYSGEMAIDPETGQPIMTAVPYSPDAANGAVPGMLTAQQMFNAARSRNGNLTANMGNMNYGFGD